MVEQELKMFIYMYLACTPFQKPSFKLDLVFNNSYFQLYSRVVVLRKSGFETTQALKFLQSVSTACSDSSLLNPCIPASTFHKDAVLFSFPARTDVRRAPLECCRA